VNSKTPFAKQQLMAKYDIIFHILNIIVAITVICSGILFAYNDDWSWGIVVAVYVIAFGVIIFIFTLKPPHILEEALGFFKWWAGRGLFYVFCGVLTVGSWNHDGFYVGVFPTVIGIIYIILQFIKGIEQPGPML